MAVQVTRKKTGRFPSKSFIYSPWVTPGAFSCVDDRGSHERHRTEFTEAQRTISLGKGAPRGGRGAGHCRLRLDRHPANNNYRYAEWAPHCFPKNVLGEVQELKDLPVSGPAVVGVVYGGIELSVTAHDRSKGLDWQSHLVLMRSQAKSQILNHGVPHPSARDRKNIVRALPRPPE